MLNLLFNRDMICPECRRSFVVCKKRIKIQGYTYKSLYIYNDFFSSLLIQYKECMDEALSDIFIYPYIWFIRLRYLRYTIVPIPSSQEKLNERGFNHVIKMFEKTRLPVCDCLEKKGSSKQAMLGKKERERMEKDICVKDGNTIPKRILLVDDVLTTGYTMQGAINALSKFECKLKILVISTHPLNIK